MLKRLASLLVAGTAAAAVALTAAPAHADTTWTVTGSSNPDSSLTGAAGVTTLTDGTVVLKCLSSTAAGTITNGTNLPGVNIAQINSIKFVTCTGPAGLTFTVAQSGVWALNAVNYSPGATPPSSGVTQGTLTNVAATLSGPGCTAVVGGSVAGSYANSTATLTIDPTLNSALGAELTVSSVSGCFGLLHVGDHPTFNGAYVLTPNTIAITSP